MQSIIEIRQLNKHFGDVWAVRDLNLTVQRGELFAFLGANGAGKSTTINILCGQLSGDSGEIHIDGKTLSQDSAYIKQSLGVVFQSSVLDGALSVYDNLVSRASLYGITGQAARERIGELAALLDFSDFIRRPVSKLSGGQRRKIDVARALLHRPAILILDEPTTGLDPQTRRLLWQVLSTLQKKEGLTVFLTTHYMEEAAEADHIVILDAGSVVAAGTPLELKNAYTADYITLYHTDESAVRALGMPYQAVHDAYRISVPNTAEATALILSHPELFRDYEITKGKMDDVFLAATGKALSGGEDA